MDHDTSPRPDRRRHPGDAVKLLARRHGEDHPARPPQRDNAGWRSNPYSIITARWAPFQLTLASRASAMKRSGTKTRPPMTCAGASSRTGRPFT